MNKIVIAERIIAGLFFGMGIFGILKSAAMLSVSPSGGLGMIVGTGFWAVVGIVCWRDADKRQNKIKEADKK